MSDSFRVKGQEGYMRMFNSLKVGVGEVRQLHLRQVVELVVELVVGRGGWGPLFIARRATFFALFRSNTNFTLLTGSFFFFFFFGNARYPHSSYTLHILFLAFVHRC